MKNLSAVIGLMLFGLAARAALPQPDLIAKIYFAGAQTIAAAPSANAFTNQFTSPEALAFRTEVATKVAGWLAGWLPANLNTPVPDGAAKLRPLFDDLQQSEFLLEIRAAAGGRPEAAIAIKLAPGRAQLWQANLKPFFTQATFRSSAGWFIFDSAPALMGLGDKLTKELAPPPADWFNLDINWPRLAQWYPQFKELGLPETEFGVSAAGQQLKIGGRFHFPDNLALKLAPWQIPLNSIHSPFDSFTAVRGFSSWLPTQKWASAYQLSPVPNQLFLWSLPGAVFPSYAAVPVPNAAAALAQTQQHLQTALLSARSSDSLISPVNANLNKDELDVSGVPFASVRARALTEPTGQFLFAELFPNPPNGLPLPPGLISRLDTKNLVFYHWESTSERVPQLLQITQLGLMLTKHKQLDGKSAAYRWLQKSASVKGASETGISQSGPAEFTFLRQGPGLFTAMELFTLANWLEANNFPGFDLTQTLPLPAQDAPPPAAPAKKPAPAAAPAPKGSH
jgi:hypothetical protein